MRRLIAACLIVALGGCSPVRTPGTGNPWTTAGTLRIGYSDEPDSLNPLYAHTSATDEADAFILAPVLRYDDHGEPLPELGREVPSTANGGISRDGRTITVRFRTGLRWSDGAPLDARDLLFTWRAVMDPKNNVKTTFGWDDIATIALPNRLTAVLHLKRPSVSVLGILCNGGSGYPPLPRHLLQNVADLNRADFNEHPISSGPYVLKAWRHGSSLEFVPNARYWRRTARIARIEWKVVPNAETLLAQLQTHEIDVYPNVVESQIDRLATLSGVVVKKRLVANYRHLEFNTRKPALADVRVRLAIAQAVDWDRINRTIYRGYNVRASSDILPTSWAAPRIPLYRYDPAAAARLLDAAGFRPGPAGLRRRADGTALALTISTGTNKPENVQAEVQMQQSLRALGIALAIKNYPVNQLFALNGPLYGGSYDLSWSVATGGPDPDNEASWGSAFVPPHGANTSRIADPLIDATAHEAAHTYDRARRKALYQVEEQRIHALVPAVFLYWQNAYSAYNADLKNYKPAQYVTDNWNAWEWEI